MVVPGDPADPGASGGLAFRRQFVLGPVVPALLSAWRQHQVLPDLMLTVHPDLPCTRAEVGGRSLFLLGHVLDYQHPESTDQAIVAEILRAAATFAEVLKAFDPFAGRWAAIYVDKGQAFVFHDPAALRQVHHGRDSDGGLWCGSRPELLARIANRPLDTTNLNSLQQAGVLELGATHFWPGTGSAFLGIDRLLPNHYLNVRTGEVQRYWPTAAVPQLDADAAITRSGEMLTGVLAAASGRYPLAMGMTAGNDTRLLLAAARGCSEQLTYYTLKKTGMTWLTPDIRIPHTMLRDLGLSHEVIPVRTMSRAPVTQVIAATFTPFHQQTADQAAALLDSPPRDDGDWVTVNGNVCEIARIPWIGLGQLTLEKMTAAVHMAASAYAVDQLTQWHEKALPAIETSGINPWEFFYWEQRLSAWGGMVRTEFDVVEEAVSPYNSRMLLECMLGVDISLRRAPDFVFFRALIESLWPQLMDYPINPKSRLGNLEHRFRRRFKSTAYSVGVRRRSPTQGSAQGSERSPDG